MRRSTVLFAVSSCLTVLLTLGFFNQVPASEATPSGSRIPPGFRAQALSWVSPEQGWMLGSAPCGQTTCTTVVGTTDGGATWNTLGTMDAPLTLERQRGVTEVRFADALHGWAFWPSLWATSDGGATWKRQVPPGGGQLVPALAGDSDAVYAVVSPCKLNHICHYAPSLWRTTDDGGSWAQVPITLPSYQGAVLAVHGVVAYLVVPAALSPSDVLDVTVDGQNWSSRPDPCDPFNDETLVDVAPISDTEVALLCVGDPGFSHAVKRVLRSDDTGQTTQAAGTTPLLGIVSELAAAPNGTLMVESWSDGSWIYRNAGGRTWSTPVSLADLGEGWNGIVFTTNQVGWVVHGPAASPWLPGELWETRDGGVTWAPV